MPNETNIDEELKVKKMIDDLVEKAKIASKQYLELIKNK